MKPVGENPNPLSLEGTMLMKHGGFTASCAPGRAADDALQNDDACTAAHARRRQRDSA